MAYRFQHSLIWKVALYYVALFALLLVLVGVIQPEWLNYLPLGGLEGLSRITALTGEEGLAGQVLTSNQPQVFFDNVINLLSAMTENVVEEDLR